MKSLFWSFLMIAVVVLSDSTAFAQKKRALPSNLNQNSSVAEIVTWLDQTTFRNARVVLKDSWDADYYSPPWDDTSPAKDSFFLTQGFRVTNIDGCNVMLRNENVRTVTKAKVDDQPPHLIADVWVQLDRMGPNRGKRTHRYTNDPGKMRLLGAWRTEFRYYGWFSRTIVELKLHSPEWKEPQRWIGLNVAFSFDTKEMSKRFDAAFRQAIKLCRVR